MWPDERLRQRRQILEVLTCRRQETVQFSSQLTWNSLVPMQGRIVRTGVTTFHIARDSLQTLHYLALFLNTWRNANRPAPHLRLTSCFARIMQNSRTWLLACCSTVAIVSRSATNVCSFPHWLPDLMLRDVHTHFYASNQFIYNLLEGNAHG